METPNNILIDPDTNIWPHELRTAEALAKAGYSVHFVRGCDAPRMHKADVVIDGQLWEMKSPETKRVERIPDIMSKALHQAHCVVFDSRRMPKVSDKQVLRELTKCTLLFRSLKHLIFVGKECGVVSLK